MKIGIDAHALGTRAGGNETYVRRLLEAVREHAQDAEITAYVQQSTPEVADSGGCQEYPLYCRSAWLRTPLELPWAAWRSQVDLIHVQYTAPLWSPVPYVVSMHDLVFLREPQSLTFATRHRLAMLTGPTLRRAAQIFVLTEAVKKDIAVTYGLPEDRFTVVQPAPDPLFQPVENPDDIAGVREKYGIDQDYILFVGLLQPRKNLIRLIDAFALLKKDGLDHKLVIAGRKAWMYKEIFAHVEALGMGADIVFTGYVDREDLPALLCGADVFAYLSTYEGFGIPILEAMACGAAVLTSTDPALSEVGGDGVLTVDPLDVKMIANQMARLLGDKDLRVTLGNSARARAAQFSLENMARAALGGYRRALGTSQRSVNQGSNLV